VVISDLDALIVWVEVDAAVHPVTATAITVITVINNNNFILIIITP
jgi:hypothetical protein